MTPASPAELLEDLAFSVLGLSEGDPLLLMLRVYADESHDSDDARVMTMAGFLAPKNTWLPLWGEWQTILNSPEFGGVVFHASDCANGAGDFQGWPLPKREALQERLIAVVAHPPNEIIGYSATIPIREYTELRPRIKEIMTIGPGRAISGPLDDPWFFVLQSLLVAVLRGAENVAPDENIGVVFDEHYLKGRVPVIYASIKMLPQFKDRLGGIAFGDKRKMVPLQVADLLAYESFRFFNDTQLGGRPERWQHVALRPRIGEAYYWGGEELEGFVSSAEKQVKEAIASGRIQPNRPQPKPKKWRRIRLPYEEVWKLILRTYRFAKRGIFGRKR